MRTLIYYSLIAVMLGCSGLSIARAQAPTKEQPKNAEAELKAAREKLQTLLAELREKELRLAQERREKEDKKAKEAKPEPQKNVIEIELNAPKIQLDAQKSQPADPAVIALHGLLKSNDPKVVALAKELLDVLAKSQTQPGVQRGGGLDWKIVPAAPLKLEGFPFSGKPGQPLELRFETIPGAKSGTVVEERKVDVARPAGPAAATGASNLKMSADGKTAAVVNADGSIVIFDVATGKEQLRFPARK
jgi:hypothetical protein